MAQGSELLTAELLDQGESLVYKVGNNAVWKIYPDFSVKKLRWYQLITDAVAEKLNGQRIEFKTSNGRFTFQWQVNPIDTVVLRTDDQQIPNSEILLPNAAIQNPNAPILRVKYPYTICPYIPGPTMEDVIHGESSEYSHVFNYQDALDKEPFFTELWMLSAELNRDLGLKCIDLEERNIKPVSNWQLNVTDVCSVVALVG